jgi:signal transduction histidine kinase
LRAFFGRDDSTEEIVDLNAATREVLALSAGGFQRSRVAVRLELASDLPQVIGDRVQLQQVILNLLLNAADATSDGESSSGTLVIRTERDNGHHVRLTVQGSGSGLEPEGAENMAEMFYTTASGAMRMGLPISRFIIESHCGRLWATRNDGAGATFAFAVPCMSTDT